MPGNFTPTQGARRSPPCGKAGMHAAHEEARATRTSRWTPRMTMKPTTTSESERGALLPPLACGSMGLGECFHFPLALAEGVTPLAAQRYIVSMYDDTACAR